MARVAVDKCETCGRERGERHRTTTKRPTLAALERMERDGRYKATDGCTDIEADGECEHGHNSWLRVLGWI